MFAGIRGRQIAGRFISVLTCRVRHATAGQRSTGPR